MKIKITIAILAMFLGVGVAHAMKSCTCPDGQMEVTCTPGTTKCKLQCSNGSEPTCITIK